MTRIIAIRVVDRIKESGHTQDVLTKHSSLIKSRLGFHELNVDMCSREGYILLHLKDDKAGINALIGDLDKIYGIEMKHMNLGPDGDKAYPIPVESTAAVVGIVINNRDNTAAEIQRIFTSYGCSIRTRLGINEESSGMDTGIMLLELTGNLSEMNNFLNRLLQIDSVYVGVISFN